METPKEPNWSAAFTVTSEREHASGGDIIKSAGGSDPRPGQYSRMSFSSDQVTGTVFSHLKIPFLPNSEFIYNIVLVGNR